MNMEAGQVLITGLNKADVLCALYDGARVQGMGFLHAKDGGLDRSEAEGIVARGEYVDYLHGRVMKVLIAGDTFRSALYDRDNGQGAAQRIVDGLRAAHPTSAEAGR